MKNVVKCYKDFFGYFNALKTHCGNVASFPVVALDGVAVDAAAGVAAGTAVDAAAGVAVSSVSGAAAGACGGC